MQRVDAEQAVGELFETSGGLGQEICNQSEY